MKRSFCSHCGNENAADMNFCLQCGRQLLSADAGDGGQKTFDQISLPPPTVFMDLAPASQKTFVPAQTMVAPPQNLSGFTLSPTAITPTENFLVLNPGNSNGEKNKWLAKTALALSISSFALFVLIQTGTLGSFLNNVGLGKIFKLFLWGGILVWSIGAVTASCATVFHLTSPQNYGTRGKAIASVILSACGLFLIIYWLVRFRGF